jgi:hypothetical protein
MEKKKREMNTKKLRKKRKGLLATLEQLIGRGFVLGNKVAGMFSYSIFFRGYALFMDTFLYCCLKICISKYKYPVSWVSHGLI